MSGLDNFNSEDEVLMISEDFIYLRQFIDDCFYTIKGEKVFFYVFSDDPGDYERGQRGECNFDTREFYRYPNLWKSIPKKEFVLMNVNDIKQKHKEFFNLF